MENTKPQEHQEDEPRHLPEIGDKPVVPWRKRNFKWIVVGSTALFVTCTFGFRFLQHYEPGPQPVYAPPAVTTLAELAVKKGFPEECLTTSYQDLFGADPTGGATPDPNVETLDCTYSGHPDGQPASSDICAVTLERNKYTDPPLDFRASVLGADGSTVVYMGINPPFSDIPKTAGVPAACVQENVAYP